MKRRTFLARFPGTTALFLIGALFLTAGPAFGDGVESETSAPVIGDSYRPTTDFTAEWIVPSALPDPMIPNLWLACRKTFSLETVPTKGRCRVAADSKFWLYVNGELAVFEGGLKRGPTMT